MTDRAWGLLALVGAALFAWTVRRALRSGVIHDEVEAVPRAGRPIYFWSIVMLCAGAGAGLFWYGVRLVAR